jgi:hypothetical protein
VVNESKVPQVSEGYSAFWASSGDSLRAMNIIGGGMKGSDGEYVDAMLQFGLAGMGLFLVLLLV